MSFNTSYSYFNLTTSDTAETPFWALYVGTTGNIRVVKSVPGMVSAVVDGAHADTTNANPAVMRVPTGHGLLAFDVVRVHSIVNDTGGTWVASGLYTLSAVGTNTITFTSGALNSTSMGDLVSCVVQGVGKSVLFTSVAVGIFPVQGMRVDATGTAATNLVGL